MQSAIWLVEHLNFATVARRATTRGHLVVVVCFFVILKSDHIEFCRTDSSYEILINRISISTTTISWSGWQSGKNTLSIKVYTIWSLTEPTTVKEKWMYNASVDYFKIFEPDFFVKFHSNEIINYQKEEEELVRGLITHEWPWPITYWGRKHLTIDQVISEGKKDVTQFPVRQIRSSAWKSSHLFILPGSGDLPYISYNRISSIRYTNGRKISYRSGSWKWGLICFRHSRT